MIKGSVIEIKPSTKPDMLWNVACVDFGANEADSHCFRGFDTSEPLEHLSDYLNATYPALNIVWVGLREVPKD